jgi:hypothetical protein
MSNRTNKATARILNRINESLSGTDLFTYTGAVFQVLKLDQAKAKGVKPGHLTAFYNSSSIVRHHKANGNFKMENGMLKLTPKGRAHFKVRLTEDSAQHVDKSEAGQIAKALLSGKVSDLPTEWRSCSMSPVTLK